MGSSPHSFIVMPESLKSTGVNDESNFLPTRRQTLRNNNRRQYSLSPSTKMRRSSGAHHVKRSRGLGLRIERKVRTLKRLIPNCNRSTGTEGLFQDTANYILSLQARVRVMQMMVDLLEGSS